MKPINKLLVKLNDAFSDEISLESGLKLYIDSSYNKEWNATVTGIVTHLPEHYDDQFADTMGQLEVGDEVAFSFRVVADFEYHSDSEHFMLVSPEESPFVRKYTNKKGDWISLRAIPSTFGHIWSAWLSDKRMNYIDGVQGSEEEIERWMAQFSFGKTDAYYFRNRLFLNGADFWKVDFENVFAVKKKNRWLSLGEKVLCKPIEADVSKVVQLSAGIHIPDSAIKLRFYDRGRLIHNVPEMGLKAGEVIGFNQQYVEKYDLDGQPYFLIKKVRIDNKWPEIFRTSTT
jgi:co-chaperonin GroES (HSP10)